MAEHGIRLAIGIDGGGTKTDAAAIDEQGAVLARGHGGPANIYAAGVEKTTLSLRSSLNELAIALPHGAMVVGLHAAMAGIGRPEDEPAAVALLTDVCRSVHLQPARITAGSDGPAVLAANGSAIGIVAIAGTGSLIWGQNRAGVSARVGGWGYLLGDEGSGFDLGRRSLNTVLAAHDGRIAANALTQAVLRHFGLSLPPDLVKRIYSSPNAREDIAGVGPITVALAAAGDELAASLVDRSARDLAAQVSAAIHTLGIEDETFPVIASGGLLSSPRLLRLLAQGLSGFNCVSVERPARSAAEGAALLALQTARG